MNRSIFKLLLGLAFSLCAYAEEQAAPSNLELINQQVAEQTAQLTQLAAEERALSDKVKDLQVDVHELRISERALKAELAAVESGRAQLESEIAEADGKISRLERLSRQRLRAAYMHRSAQVFEDLLLASQQGNLGKNAFLLRKLQEFDRAMISELAGLIQRNTARKAELLALEKQKSQVVARISGQRIKLEGKLAELERSLAQLQSRKNSIKETITALNAQALRLETVVASMTGADEPVAVKPDKTEKKLAARGAPPYDGPGLFRLKGALTLPLQGEVIAGFGKRKVAEFQDLVFSKGVEYRSQPQSDVRAIAAGRVLHLGRMPGYGTVLIIDHGSRYYSLYGMLAESKAEVGEEVEKGQVLGKTGPHDAKGRNFYFEIRRNGLAVNPQDYFKRL